jgi:opacity protein-like surface antigen
MKSHLICPLLALGLGTVAFAGETTAPSTYTAPPSEAPSLWNWYAGASIGYLVDSEEDYYTLHLGMKIGESGPVTHSLFLEGAYTELSDLGLDTEIVPVTLNYKFDYYFTDSLSFYAGAGVGAAFVSNDFPGFSDDSVELAAQIFAGIGYDLTPNFQIYTGARWIWIDDSDIAGVAVDIGDDVGLELGARFKF